MAASMLAPAVFAFGLVAFGFLGMGPVTIAVDSYGPVTDNAQSVYELSLIEQVPNVKAEIKKDFNMDVNFDRSKDLLEENDGAGNTFKATAKPVLIGTAVVGATTMIFSIIMALTNGLTANVDKLSLLHAPFFLGLITGGAMIYWFTGASTQAVTTGAYRAVEFIKANIKLEGVEKASVADSKKVVEICTKYAQKGMFNIFLAVFFGTLTFAFVEPFFFIGYLISIALFGLYQAIFMANAGAAWDNAKKIVEIEMKQKGTPLHDATVIGDTVGDPFKDTSSVAMNPVIKFTTLFGLLAVELAVSLTRDQGALLDAWAGAGILRGVVLLRVPVVLRDADWIELGCGLLLKTPSGLPDGVCFLPGATHRVLCDERDSTEVSCWRPAPAENGVTFLLRRWEACHRSYCVCMPIQSSGLVPRASASFSAMSAEIPALPFKMRDRATRVTPRCLAVFVTDRVPKYSRRTLPGCGGLCMRIKTSQW